MHRYTLMYYKKGNAWAQRRRWGGKQQAFQLQSKHMSKDELLVVAEECRKKTEVDGWDEKAAKEYGQGRLKDAVD